jgi:hypothetical protein
MTIITPAEQTLLRSRPHETSLWLSIYDPEVALACQVNCPTGTAPGLRDIPTDTITHGAYVNIELGMTMYVGTTPGARDVGRIRVRYASGTVITVGDNSDINWQDDQYLTVLDFWEIESVYPRIDVPDWNDPTHQVWYKDYDVAYTNQNSVLGSLICMGPHHAGFIHPDTGLAYVYYSSTGTVAFGVPNGNFSCAWEFEGGTPATSVANIPGWVTYNTPGHYTTKLTVTNLNSGAVDVSYRHISIYERPEAGTHNPILNWELVSLDGSRDNNGYTARVKVRENISSVVDGALMIIFAEDKYGGIAQSIGGNYLNREKTVFVGYIIDGSINYDYENNSVEFTVGSPTEIMKLSEGFGVALNNSTDPTGQAASDPDIPSAWVLMLDMNCRRALYHYLKWHSTVFLTNDFTFEGTDKYINYFDANRESLFDAVNNLMKGTLRGAVVCDRQGKIWAEVDIGATNNATGTFPVAMDIDRQDWIGTPTIEETQNYQTSYIEMGGIEFNAYSGTSVAHLACAPGPTPSYRGNVQTIEGLALNSQADLNELVGNVFAYINSRYGHVGLDLAGDYRNIDIAPQEILTLSLDATDNPQHIAWNKKAFHPTSINWSYDPLKGAFMPTLELHEVTQGFAGSTIIIPPIPPTNEPYIPPFVPPSLILPSFGVTINIFHNGVFIVTTSNINFIDDDCS